MATNYGFRQCSRGIILRAWKKELIHNRPLLTMKAFKKATFETMADMNG